eukprot:11182730-Lingulodinium_polyedra.AAC.1
MTIRALATPGAFHASSKPSTTRPKISNRGARGGDQTRVVYDATGATLLKNAEAWEIDRVREFAAVNAFGNEFR